MKCPRLSCVSSLPLLTLGGLWSCAPAAPPTAPSAPPSAGGSLYAGERAAAAESNAAQAGTSTKREVRGAGVPVSLQEFGPCGPLECKGFASALDALHEILKAEPLVVAVGEAHAPRDSESTEPAVRRFGGQLLPELIARGGKQLVVELVVPAAGCQKPVEDVRRAERPVTEEQAPTNQSDYVWLGTRARELGIVPFVLEPSCQAFAQVSAAGDDAVYQLLTLIRNEAGQKIARFAAANLLQDSSGPAKERALPKAASDAAAPGGGGAPAASAPSDAAPTAAARSAASTPSGTARDDVPPSTPSAPTPLVIAYGGALHNDTEPRPGREDWSFGPQLLRLTQGRYVELDLIIPEYIRGTEVWQSLAWYDHFTSLPAHDAVVLYRQNEHSFTLIFPWTRAPVPE